jgi:PPOX class probable F420-dependent enzyme
MAATFDEGTRNLLDGRNFATIATVNPDGSPHTSVVWVMREGDTVLFSTTASRRKARNLARDPRISLSIFDTANPYQSADISGAVELTVDESRTLPKALSHKYLGEDPPPEPDAIVRLIVRVTPDKVTTFSV